MSTFKELKQDYYDDTVSLQKFLRKARVTAATFDLHDFLKVIDLELDGYNDPNDNDWFPKYRWVNTQPQILGSFNEWEDIIIVSTDFCYTAAVRDSIIDIEKNILKIKGSQIITVKYPKEIEDIIYKEVNEQCLVRACLKIEDVSKIPNRVRDNILDWVIKLEKQGILGEDMTVSTKEKTTTTHVTNHISANNISSLAGNNASNFTVTQNVYNQIYNVKKVEEVTQQISLHLNLLPTEIQNEVAENVRIIDAEIQNEQPNHACLTKCFTAIKSLCENVGANIIASGIIECIRPIMM